MAEVPFRPVRQLSEYKGKGASRKQFDTAPHLKFGKFHSKILPFLILSYLWQFKMFCSIFIQTLKCCRYHYYAKRGKNSLIYTQLWTLAWAAYGHRYDKSPVSKIYTTLARIVSVRYIFCILRGGEKNGGVSAIDSPIFLIWNNFEYFDGCCRNWGNIWLDLTGMSRKHTAHKNKIFRYRYCIG